MPKKALYNRLPGQRGPNSKEEHLFCVTNLPTGGGLTHSEGKNFLTLPGRNLCATLNFQKTCLIGRHLVDEKGTNVSLCKRDA